MPHYYAAINVSVLDPLAPLAELAIRDRTQSLYTHDTRLAWDVVALRADILFAPIGPPPSEVAPMMPGVVTTYNYGYFWDNTNQLTRFIEFGFVLKYVI